MTAHNDIRIGTLIHEEFHAVAYIEQMFRHGFESYELTFSRHVGPTDLASLAEVVRAALADNGNVAVISALGIYGNPLTDEQTARDWARLIDAADSFGCRLVCGFTGRIPNTPVPESLPPMKKLFQPLLQRAEDKGVRLAFETCAKQGTWEWGDWNIAHAPAAWEMIFNELPSDSLGLEWEPCHQMASLIDPLPQLRHWAGKVFHVHGKDATVLWDVIRTQGIRGPHRYVYHRTPGFGDTNWTEIISILRAKGFHGSIDIEGRHDPVYRDELEMTGQVHALEYLKQCRGGPFVPNPTL